MPSLVQFVPLSIAGLLAGLGLGLHPTPLGSQDPLSQELAAWGSSLDLDDRIVGEILRFQGGEGFDSAAAAVFAQEVRAQLVLAAVGQVDGLLSGDCQPFVHVTIGESESLIPEGVPPEAEKNWKRFVDSLIRTEMVACLETDITDPADVLEIYVGPEFRMAAESRIVDMWTGEEGACMETKGVLSLVEPTRICNRIREFRREVVAAEHSQLVFNEGQRPYEDVYFKESLKTFLRTPGGMALHYINYTRAGTLGRVKRWAGPGQIRGSQEGVVKELQRRLSGS